MFTLNLILDQNVNIEDSSQEITSEPEDELGGLLIEILNKTNQLHTKLDQHLDTLHSETSIYHYFKNFFPE